jgi:hypothetical protein
MMMMNTTISIDKIEVSISGLSSEIVKRSFANFDKELALQAGKLLMKGNQNGIHNLDTINVGNLQVHHNIQPAQLRKIIADRILKSIVQESL